MSTTMHSFYLDRAAESRRDARDATLVNVRERFLASEQTWRELATRAKKVETQQMKLIARKSAERAALASASPSL
ncbi:hypothetical protein [Allosphingosinicella sp.]|jgi:hypothetical protein|uniref:hypothetical protein n=1 Tax=Allosphingosinicella sp. TaxID=2823234 RepID=UPI002F1ACAB6